MQNDLVHVMNILHYLVHVTNTNKEMSLEFSLKFNFLEAKGFSDNKINGYIKIGDQIFSVNFTKLFYLSPSLRTQISVQKAESANSIHILDSIPIIEPKNYSVFFDYVNGHEIKLDFHNAHDLNELARLFHIPSILEYSMPLLIFIQQMKTIRKQVISNSNPQRDIIHALALLFPLVSRLPLTATIFPLLRVETMKQILLDEKLFPISDDSKVRSMMPYLERFSDEVVSYFSKNSFSINESLYNEVQLATKSLTPKIQKNILQFLKKKSSDNNDSDIMTKIEKEEFVRCWENFMNQLSPFKFVYQEEKEEIEEEKEEKETHSQTLSSTSSFEVLDVFSTNVSDVPEEKIHFSTEFLRPSNNPFSLKT